MGENAGSKKDRKHCFAIVNATWSGLRAVSRADASCNHYMGIQEGISRQLGGASFGQMVLRAKPERCVSPCDLSAVSWILQHSDLGRQRKISDIQSCRADASVRLLDSIQS